MASYTIKFNRIQIRDLEYSIPYIFMGTGIKQFRFVGMYFILSQTQPLLCSSSCDSTNQRSRFMSLLHKVHKKLFLTFAWFLGFFKLSFSFVFRNLQKPKSIFFLSFFFTKLFLHLSFCFPFFIFGNQLMHTRINLKIK